MQRYKKPTYHITHDQIDLLRAVINDAQSDDPMLEILDTVLKELRSDRTTIELDPFEGLAMNNTDAQIVALLKERDEARDACAMQTIKLVDAGELHLADKTTIAQLERQIAALREALDKAHGLIVKHHAVNIMDKMKLGTFCPVCHHADGTEPEIDFILKVKSDTAAIDREDK